MDALKIFVSHSHEDNNFCHQLARALREAGADVWFDEHNLGAGHLLDTVERELRNRQVFLLILSPASLQSQWVRNEATWAFNRTQHDPQRIFLPILAQPIDADTLWLFIESYKRIEVPGGVPYPPEEAIRRTLHILSLMPPDKHVIEPRLSSDDLILQGQVLTLQGRYQQSCEVLQQAFTLQPHNTNTLYLLGYSLRHLHRYDEALASFNQALALNSTSATEWTGKGAVLWQLNRYTEALEAVDTAIALDSKQANAWNIRSIVLSLLKRHDEALAALDRALFLKPSSIRFWGNKAMILIWNRRYHAALMAAEITLELEPDNMVGITNKSWALLGLQRFEEALTTRQQGLLVDENEMESWLCGAYTLRCLNRVEEAEIWEAHVKMLAKDVHHDFIPFGIEGDFLVALR